MTDPTPISRTPRFALRICSDATTATPPEPGVDGLELSVGPLESAEHVSTMISNMPPGHTQVIAVSAVCQTADIATQAPIVAATLAAAARVGATCLNLALPPIRSTANPNGFPSYQSAINFLHELFRTTRFEAERSGVALAIEVANGGCFLSPVEMRDLVDTANSWAVGVCLDADRIAKVAQPADWIRTLTHRLHAVRLSGDTQQTNDALNEVGFDGVICIDAPTGPATAKRIRQELSRRPGHG